MGKKLLKFLKKQALKALKEKTDLIMIAVFVVMILICIINTTVLQKDDLEVTQRQLGVAGIDNINNLAAESEGSVEASIVGPVDSDFSDVVTDEEIPVGNNDINELGEELSEEPEEDKDAVVKEDTTVKEDIVEEDISLENRDNNPILEEEQDVDFSNGNDFRIEVDLIKQKVFVYYKEELIREMICSGGAEESPTPTGEFITSQKIEYSWIPRFNVGAYYWIRFYKSYLFHSVPFDKDGNMIMEEYEKLGSPVSHGCIRLKLEEAKWLYTKLPLRVKVLIY